MPRGALIVIFTTCALASARQVNPRATELEKLLNSIDLRYSTDVFEDAILSVPDLIRKYGYPVEVHSTTTDDGYILEMHRIPHGRDNKISPPGGKPVVFLMHGLLCSSSCFLFTGPGSAFAYLLADAGYDVWMGNARGNTYSRKHVRLNPDALIGTRFWQFSWDEIGHMDLPAMIDYTLQTTGKDKLHYAGHSQGTTAFFTMASLRPEYNNKIISMQALAPVAYMAHNSIPLLQLISPLANNIEQVGALLGVGELLQHREVFTWAGQQFCSDQSATQALCSNMIFLVGGYNPSQLNATILPLVLGHAPAGAAVRQLVHYAQGIAGKEFRRYDHGSLLENWQKYRSFTPPRYDIGKITAPMFLHYSDNDHFAELPDVDRLFRELPNAVKIRVPLAEFTHVDFMWAINAKELLYDRVINLIATMESNSFSELDINNL